MHNEQVERVPPKTTYLRQGAPTIRDVAKEANVALGTASRVLTGSPRVKPQTRERVLEVAARLGYRPNPTARALARGKTNTIGVLVPFFFTRQNHVEVVRGVQAGISEFDYSLAIHSVETPEQARAQFASFNGRGRIDGLIIVSLDANVIVDEPRNEDLPILCVDTSVPGLPGFSPDHEKGSFLATNHLIDVHGHRALAFVDRPQDSVSHAISPARHQGFLRAHRRASLPVRPELTVVEDYTPDGGYRAARRLLDLPAPPTAIVCASDLQAIGVLRAARELNLSVGRDLAIVGYNDVIISEYLGLTTVHVPSFEIGRAAVATLLALAAGEQHQDSPSLVEPRLVLRTSCGCGE
jgi:DNA-binding LacI/PurR family transcriptional regulator